MNHEKPKKKPKKARPNRIVNEKIKELWPKAARLAPLLNYANRSTLHNKMKGLRSWDMADAINLERLSGGKINRREVYPNFEWDKPLADPEA